MIDVAFSAESFELRGLDTKEADELAQLLAAEIDRELRELIEPRFQAIVGALNSLGHHLKPEFGHLAGAESFRDDDDSGSEYMQAADSVRFDHFHRIRPHLASRQRPRFGVKTTLVALRDLGRNNFPISR